MSLRVSFENDDSNFRKMILNIINEIYKHEVSDTYKSDTNENLINWCKGIGLIDEATDLLKEDNVLPVDIKENLNALAYYSESRCNSESECSHCEIKKFCNKYRKDIQLKYAQDNGMPTMIDLFCGAGGLSSGFAREGYKILLANDIEKVCVDTYRLNHPEIPEHNVIHGDIKELLDNIEEKLCALEPGEVDLIAGGPPCQGFSMANRQRIIDDPRNVLYKYFVGIVEKVKPKFILMENVKGMLKVADQIKEDFRSIGYDVEYKVFNAKDFSVPQNRERLIYVGSRIGISGSDLIKQISDIKNEQFVLRDALSDLRPLEPLRIMNATELDTIESGKKIDYVDNFNSNTRYTEMINNGQKFNLMFNHKARYNNDRDIEIFSRMLPGDKSDSERIADIMPYKSRNDIFKDKYFKLEGDKVCKTITAHMKFDCNMYIHPTQPRGLTPREAARVQSYPDDYIFTGPFTKTYMQVGNSVPPLMARVFAKVIKKYIL